MKAATAAEMRKIDQTAIKTFGIPGTVLMENAGVEAARQIEAALGAVDGKMICIFAGKGNNGGDGFVAARHLYNQGAKIKVFLLGLKSALTGDAKVNLDIIIRMGISVIEISGSRDWEKAKIAVTFADCLVDALLGTGFIGEVTGEMAQAVDIINKSGKLTFAIDIPTGVDADTGQIRGAAVSAHYTVTFGLPKSGLLIYPGAQHVGKLTVADIGIPFKLLVDDSIKQNIVTAGSIKAILGTRAPDAHKGTTGNAVVIAGSQGMTGAAALTAMAVLRTGAGLVTLGIAESLNYIMEVKLTEVITRPLPESAGGTIGRKALPYIEDMASKSKVLAIGPGLGRNDETMAVVRETIKNAECPLVIDADALNALVGHTDLLNQAKALPVVTPHPGEMARLMGLTVKDVSKDRVGIARRAAGLWGAIVVLKGARTIVAYPDGEVYINTTGNPGMATGGTGDVLTGVIAGLIAQGLTTHAAAVAGVHIHGLAGDIAAASGTIGLIAGDVVAAMPAAIIGIQGI
ncbi:Bifunctional NAD(P)H-hydrate repair enzyme Nnr [bioreactor metagenome]|uniref:Nicotinamide nucleotide repair protein n=1 Tax=bioreactor metagenome TaxID=1076179 RepID=A0A644ZSF8_9ZZZZ